MKTLNVDGFWQDEATAFVNLGLLETDAVIAIFSVIRKSQTYKLWLLESHTPNADVIVAFGRMVSERCPAT